MNVTLECTQYDIFYRCADCCLLCKNVAGAIEHPAHEPTVFGWQTAKPSACKWSGMKFEKPSFKLQLIGGGNDEPGD